MSVTGWESKMRKRQRIPSYILPRLREARTQPLSDMSSVEDYMEVIYELIEEKGYARSVDISRYLGVKSPSVTSMLQRLDRMRLVDYEKYRGIRLTAKGERLAKSVKERHLVITRFLQILGVTEDIANSDAEGIEHHVHRTTIDRISRFVDFVNNNHTWFETFERSLPSHLPA